MWDADADGYARGDGVAAVILKTLSTAIADGDHVECLIRETGINQDGHTKGITMPSASAQTDLIQTTYAKAGLDLKNKLDRPQFFEAHGTGTPAGDPIENVLSITQDELGYSNAFHRAQAIHNAFFGPSQAHLANDVIHVGSIKTIIGHTEGAAGLSSVLKASLALQNAVIPPNMLLERLSPTVRPFYNGLCIPIAPVAWPSLPAGQCRRASVNSFGEIFKSV